MGNEVFRLLIPVQPSTQACINTSTFTRPRPILSISSCSHSSHPLPTSQSPALLLSSLQLVKNVCRQDHQRHYGPRPGPRLREPSPRRRRRQRIDGARGPGRRRDHLPQLFRGQLPLLQDRLRLHPELRVPERDRAVGAILVRRRHLLHERAMLAPLAKEVRIRPLQFPRHDLCSQSLFRGSC